MYEMKIGHIIGFDNIVKLMLEYRRTYEKALLLNMSFRGINEKEHRYRWVLPFIEGTHHE